MYDNLTIRYPSRPGRSRSGLPLTVRSGGGSRPREEQMAEAGYFHRVHAQTPTRFWINNPTRDEADRAIAEGAVGCTCNPSYCQKMIDHPSEGDYSRPLLDEAVRESASDDEAEALSPAQAGQGDRCQVPADLREERRPGRAREHPGRPHPRGRPRRHHQRGASQRRDRRQHRHQDPHHGRRVEGHGDPHGRGLRDQRHRDHGDPASARRLRGLRTLRRPVREASAPLPVAHHRHLSTSTSSRSSPRTTSTSPPTSSGRPASSWPASCTPS